MVLAECNAVMRYSSANPARKIRASLPHFTRSEPSLSSRVEVCRSDMEATDKRVSVYRAKDADICKDLVIRLEPMRITVARAMTFRYSRLHWFSLFAVLIVVHPRPQRCRVLYTVLYKDWFPLNQRKMKTVFRPFTTAFRFIREQAASRFTHSCRSINNIVCLYYYRSADICGLNGCF